MIEDIRNYRTAIFSSENILAKNINDEYFNACLDVFAKFSKDFGFIKYGDTENIKQILSDIECLFDSELKRQNLLELVHFAKNAYQNYKKHLQDNIKENNAFLNEYEQIDNLKQTKDDLQEQNEEENQYAENKEEYNEATSNQNKKKKPIKTKNKNQKDKQNQENENLENFKNEENNLSKEYDCLNQENKEENLEEVKDDLQEQNEENQSTKNSEELNNKSKNKNPRKNKSKNQEISKEQNEEQNQEEILSDDELDELEQELNEILKVLEFLNDESDVDNNSNQENTKNQQSSSTQTPQINPKKRDLKNFKKRMQDFFSDRGVGGEKDIVKASHSYRNDNIKKSEIKRLCKMICEGFGIGVSKNDKHNLGYELDGITSSDILKNALPSEFALLNDSLAENLFFAKFCEKSLSTWLNKSSDKGKISPLIIAIDNSGSMSGAPEMVAKTVGYYLINECKQHKKECILILAGSGENIKTSKKHGYDELLYALSKYKASGGYDIDWVLKASLKKAREYNNKANLLAISDFCIGDVFLRDIQDELNAVKSYALFISFFGGNRFDVVGFHKYFLYDNYNHTINVLERKDREEKLKRKIR
ncbi:hypothetical protein [Campylobacter sp. MG1]|uniref:hypothetical protein n=1 Tax=Campylobacter sp. MG1 TaxID=2976332 RepID=UPI00226CB322|nr:hypothetical protein [Campylobacter sp. MG1]